MKTCSKCGKSKSLLEAFHIQRKSADGRRSACKMCRAASFKVYREKNLEARKTAERAYVAGKGRKVRRRYHRQYRKVNRDRIRQISRESQRRARAQQDPVRRQRKAARAAVHRAIVAGRLFREPCAACGLLPAVVNGRNRIEAHHYLGYDKENWLTVEWYCAQHHHDADHVSPNADSGEAVAAGKEAKR